MILFKRFDTDAIFQRLALLAVAAFLIVVLALPLGTLFEKSFRDRDGVWVGLANWVRYLETPSLVGSLWNTIWVSALATAIVVPLAFVYAYALTRTTMRWRGLFRAVGLVPILAPSLLPAISLIYLFGNQGFARWMLMGETVYGPIGIVIAQVFYCFPHAFLILATALSIADKRHYEAASVLGAGQTRIFLTVTLPGVKYGLVSAFFVVFTLVATDFGIPKVIGGRFNVLATDIYKQVVGQQNFEMGAVVGMVLLLPAMLAFAVDRWVAKRQVALLTARAVPYEPKPNAIRDRALFAFCALIAACILTLLGVAVWASFIQYWPWNTALTLRHYVFSNADASGWEAYWNSLQMSALVATFGTAAIGVGAWLVEKTKGAGILRGAVHLLAMIPLAVPGLVLGIAYIFFFNAPSNPLGFVYGTMAILVLNTIAHFYTVAHLTSLQALKQMDPEFESVSASLKVSVWRTAWRVTLPVASPAALDVWFYMFVNSMTTVSAVVFLYGPFTKLASVSIVNMDEAGFTASAAAMGVVVVLTSGFAKILHSLLAAYLAKRTQAWRAR
ncbi:MAG: putative 2-aminoethylphosphonate ABC transporter permease subunit [Azospirillum sp.]|nr:putative 2-aminoethylphosphonate ABC transporter permease subunit [Azospirillum sp.]MCZ8124120.1 putative 2-aminoethylphosphonate ABC transporter permease subunit [Magnetospirillum sp.]